MRDRSALLRKVTIVVLTHNRCAELARTLDRLEMARADGAPEVVVVDNASTDGTTRSLRGRRDVRVVRLARNAGGAGRNAGATTARTPYVAFCDDDTWWGAGSLETAVAALEQRRDVAVVCGRVLVGSDQRLDQTCAQMAHSPLGVGDEVGGHPVLGFLAGACVVRRDAFLSAGGFDERFFIGGEEELVALDLAVRGWQLRYLPAVVVHHHPSDQRDPSRRRLIMLRNRLWVGLLRYPAGLLFRHTREVFAQAGRHRLRRAVLAETARGLPWLLRGRDRLPSRVARQVELLQCHLADTSG